MITRLFWKVMFGIAKLAASFMCLSLSASVMLNGFLSAIGFGIVARLIVDVLVALIGIGGIFSCCRRIAAFFRMPRFRGYYH